jgi:hypothetical protein
MQMQIAISFRNAVWKIRAASSIASPAEPLYQPFEPEKWRATLNRSWMRLRVLRRDRYRCRGCGSREMKSLSGFSQSTPLLQVPTKS